MTFGPGQTGHIPEHNRLAADLAFVEATYVTEGDVSTIASAVLAAQSAYLPLQVFIDDNLDATRPDWAGPVWWVTTVVAGVPSNAIDGDQVIEVSAEAVDPTAIFSDDFARSDGSPGNTPVGGLAWTPLPTPGQTTPVAAIASGALGFTSAGASGNAFCVVDANAYDGIYQVTYSAVGSRQGGIVFRFVDAANHLLIAARIAGGNNHYRIAKRVSGTVTAIFDTSVTSTTGDILTVAMNGSAVSVDINGSNVWSGTVSEFTTGDSFGVYTAASELTPTFDDISLTTLV